MKKCSLAFSLFVVMCVGSPVLGQSVLVCGQTTAGAVASAADLVQYTFSIPAGGDILALSIASATANFTPRFRLYDPDGREINTSTSFSIETVTKAGTYRITVGYSSGTVTAGGFRLSRQSLRNPCNAAAIRCGDNPQGRLEQVSEMDAYTFTGTAGDPIKLQIGSSQVNGFNPLIRLYEPDGREAASSTKEIKTTLTQTGIYKVIVLQYSGTTRTGEYGLTLQNLRTPCNTQSLSCGVTRYGVIRNLASFDTYRFSATANEPIMLWAVTTTRDVNSQTAGSYFNAEMELYAPDGTYLTSLVSSKSGEIIRTPAVTGTYTLLVHSETGDEAGDYQLTLQRLKNPCNATPLSACQRIRGTISTQAEIDAYTINGTAGQTIPLQAIGDTTLFRPDASLFDPDGLPISSLTRAFAKSGQHTLIIHAQGNTGMTGNYTVSSGSAAITVTAPLNGEMLIAGEKQTIAWEASSTTTGTTFDLLLSLDGGATYPTVLAANLSRTTTTYEWTLPTTLSASRARIRVVSKDASGNSCQASSDADFFIVALGAGSVVNYKYDDLNQLIEVGYDNGTKITYTYDEVGNRLSETVTVPNAPTVATTASATEITQTGARLNGSLLISNGTPASYAFEWGRSSALVNPSLTPAQQIGGAGGGVSATLTGLLPDTEYFYRLAATSGANAIKGEIRSFKTAAALAMTTVSAASFARGAVASGAIVSIFGQSLATSTALASSVPLPTSLAGTTVRVTDSKGVERLAPLFFVAPFQTNCLIPEGTEPGAARIVVISGDGKVSAETVEILAVAPALFTANSSGAGLAAGNVLRVKADGTQLYEAISRFDPGQNKVVPVPIDLGPASDAVFLILYGTGLRSRSALSAVTARIGGANAEVLYAGPVAGLAGLDQVNLGLPRELLGRGVVEILVTADGKAALPVQVTVGPVTAATPSLASLSPSAAPAGSAAFTLTVSGSNFTNGSTVRWNNADRPTSFVSNAQLKASISAGDVANAGAASVSVFNSDGGGGSNALSFQITQTCAYALSPTSQSFGEGAANGSFSVSAANGCAWTATAAASWITINAGANGSGNGTVSYAVAANSTPASRTGTISVASQTFTITQAGATPPAPTLSSLTPSTVLAGSPAFTLTVSGANFTASSIVRWNGGDRPTTFVSAGQLKAAIPASDAAGAGTAVVTVFNPNPGSNGGGVSNSLSFTIAPPCTYALSPSSQAFAVEGGGGILNVAAPAGCAWTASANVNWITVNSGDAGTGDGVITYSVAPNPGSGSRAGAIVVASQSFSVTQAGAAASGLAITSLVPSKATPCGPAFSLTVNGTGFAPGSVVRWKGEPRATTFVSNTQLRADILASDLTAPTTAAVTVFNSATGSVSNSVDFPLAFDDGPVRASTILPGQTVSGALTSDDQVQRGGECKSYYFDAFSFTTTAANTSVAFDLRSAQFDASVLLFKLENGALTFVASDDITGGYGNGKVENTNALLLTVLASPGTYVAFATTADGNPGGLGAYTLKFATNVLQPIGYGVSLPNATIAATDLQTSGGTYLDAYWFTGAAGDNLQITMRSTAFDSFLILQKNQGGAPLAFDDNSAGGPDALINFRLAEAGTYVILATPFELNKTGGYSIALTRSSAATAAAQAERARATSKERAVPTTSPKSNGRDLLRYQIRRALRIE